MKFFLKNEEQTMRLSRHLLIIKIQKEKQQQAQKEAQT